MKKRMISLPLMPATITKIFVALAMLVLPTSLLAQTTIVSSAGGGNWNVTGSWAGGIIPGANDSVVISGGNITLTDARSVGSITIPSGKTLTISNGQTLTVAKTSAGPILGGYFTNNGTLTSGGSTATIQMGTNGVIGGSSTTTIGQLTINTTNTTDIVYLNVSRIIISNGGTLFLTKGIFNVGASRTVQMGTTAGTTINATGGGNFATTGANGGEDGGNVDCRAGSGGTLSISGTGSVGSPTFYNVFNGSGTDANWRFGCTTAGIKVNGTLSASTLDGASVANANQWAATGNSPVYGPSSTLLVNRNGQGWTPSLEWNATSGYIIGTTPGYPNNVTIANVGTSGGSVGGVNIGVNISTARNINGTLTIGTSTISGAVGISSSSFVCGGIVINSGSVLGASSNFRVNGNWLRQGATIGAFSATAGITITFGGSGTAATPQTIGLSTGTETFNNNANIAIANGTYVKLNCPVTMGSARTVTLTSGIIETDATNVLSITNTATSALSGSGSATNCITGPVKWTLLNSGTNTYVFPVASGTSSITYLPFTLSSTNTVAGNVATIQAFAGSFSGTADGSTLSAVSNTEYWSLGYSSSVNSGSTVSIGRTTALGGLSLIGRSITNTGTGGGSYSSIGGTVSGNNINNSTTFGTGTAFNFQLASPPVPTIALADNAGGQVGAANLGTGSTDNPIANFQLTVGTADAVLKQLTFVTTGTAASGTDITNFKLYYSATNNFAARTLVTGATLTSGLGAGSHVFGPGSTLNQTVPVGTRYFWITTDIPSSATGGTIQVSAISPASNLVFTSGTPTGSTTQAGVQTITVLPTVTTTAATSITTTGAVINGTVNPNGPSTNNKFDWGVTQYNNTDVAATTNPTASGSSPVSIALTLSGLTPNTLYNFRAKSDNGNAGSPVLGSNLTFTTISNAPTVGNASAPTSNGFTASWSAPGSQGGAALTYTVQVYNTSNTLILSVPSISGTSTVISNVALSPNTTYYFRVVAVNAGGTSAQSAASANITTGDADSDGAAPGIGNNIRSAADQYLLRSRQRDRYLYDNGASNTVNGFSAITLKFDNSSASPSGLGPNSVYAWYMVNQGGSNFSIQNVSTGRYLINGGGSPGDGYVGFVAGTCDTRNWNTISLVDATTFNTISNTNKKWFTRSVNASIYYQFASLYGNTDGNYSGYYMNTDYTGTNNGNNNTNVLVSGANCSTSRDFQFTQYIATPDLQVTNVTTNLVNNNAAINTAFLATATIKNDGLIAIANGTNIKVKFVIDGKIFTTTYSGGLTAGQSVTLPAVSVTPNLLTAGSPLVVTVNSNWNVAEYDYSNNTFTIPGIAVMQPSLNILGTLSALSTTYGTASAFTSYDISGTSLVNDVVVSAPSGFEVSKTTGGASGYAAVQNLTPSGTTLATTTIYVRLAATTAAGPHSGNITNATTGLSTQNVSIPGSTVNKATITITAGNQSVFGGTPVATVTGNGTYTPSGFVNGENASVIAGTVSYTTNYTITTPAGASGITITPVVTGLSATNYDFTPADGNITVTISPAVADYRSKAAGNLSNIATWEYYNGTSWVNATQKPGSGNNVTILHNVTFDEGFTVGAGKVLTVSAGTANFNGQLVTFKSDNSGTAQLAAVTGTITGATNVTVERFIPARSDNKPAWKQLSVPTTGSRTIRQSWMEGDANAAPMANNAAGFGTLITTGYANRVGGAAQNPGGFDAQSQTTSIRYYNGSAFVAQENVNRPVQDSMGFFLFVRGDRSVGFAYVDQQTNQTITPAANNTVLRSNGGIVTGDVKSYLKPGQSFKLVANPYPSAIDFNSIGKTGSISNTLYLWDAALGTNGNYETFTQASGYQAATGGGSWAQNEVNSTIQSGQAFLVGSTGAGGFVTISESSKVGGSNNKGLRPAAPAQKISTRLYVGTKAYDGTTVVFGNKYSNAIDNNDALKLQGPGENLSISKDGQSLAVEARATLSSTEEEVIAYNLSNLKQQTYTLEISGSNMSGLAYLKDKYLGTTTPVELGTATKVEFSVTADAASAAADRFSLVLRPAATTTPDTRVAAIKVSPNPVEGAVLNLQFIKQDKGRYAVTLTDLAGRILYNGVKEHAGGTAVQQVQLPSGLAKGAYHLSITAPDQTRQVQQVQVQ